MDLCGQNTAALDFVFDHPFAEFMDEFVDASTALVDGDVEIVFAVVGDTELAHEIFLTSAQSNIFVKRTADGAIEQNRVRCHIFDGGSGFRASLSDGYYRFANGFFGCDGKKPKRDARDYLPFPEYPTVDTYHAEPIGSSAFFNELSAALKLEYSGKIARFIAVCTDSEKTNGEIAREVWRLKTEHDSKHTVVFAKCPEELLPTADKCFSIADTGNGVHFAVDAALARHRMYVIESLGATDERAQAEAIARADAELAAKSQFERALVLYACLALRAKLILCGLDITRRDSGAAIGEDEYAELMGVGVPFDSTKPFDTTVRRNILAAHEHFRWNARMLVCGFVPADRRTILEETVTVGGKSVHTNGKSFAARRHGNLTTLDGLKEFAAATAARDGVSAAQKDVIKYDFQIMDGAFRIVDGCGYEIIMRR